MTGIDIAAIIGAAAWVPQILAWIYQAAARPRVHLVPGSRPQVGYTTFGPIFNLNCALSTSICDAVVRRIEVKIQHEKGQSTMLTWATLSETFSQITNQTTGEEAEVSKRQLAFHMKLSPAVLSEKLIGFQDFGFQAERNQLVNALIELTNHEREVNPDHHTEVVLKSKQLADVINHYKNNAFWQIGHYAVEFKIYLMGIKEATIQKLEFVLNENDIRQIKLNIAEIEKVIHDTIVPLPRPAQSKWNWINPDLQIAETSRRSLSARKASR